jgi:hypothetical protein
MKTTIEFLEWGISEMEYTLSVYKKCKAKQFAIDEMGAAIARDKAELEKLKKN